MKPVKLEILLGGNMPQYLDNGSEQLNQLRKEARNVTDEIEGTDRAAQRLNNTVKNLVSAFAAKQFLSSVVRTRGEFQQLQVAMETMLGSTSKAQSLMAQMVETAATTPFGLDEVANGAKQLLAYGLGADKVNDTLIRLGDIASGLSIPLNDLVYLYGTTMAQGRLYTQDLNQFTGRGIPMIRELANVLGVAENKVKSLVEEGKVGFPEVQKVIENLTKEGGTFGGLMEKQSKTITGQISNIEDAFDMMFNEIGQKNEGVINDALEATTWLVEHYELVGDTLMTLVASYGAYKAVLMATTAYTAAAYNYEIAQLKTILGGKTAEIDADLASAVSKGRMTSARAAEVQALRQELAAKIQNAKAIAIEAQAEASAVTRKRMMAQLAYDRARAEVEAKQMEIAAMESIYAYQTVETLQKEKDTLVTKMHAAQEKLDAAAKMENVAKTKAATTAQAVNTLMMQKDTLAKKLNVTQTRMLTVAMQGLKKGLNAVKTAFATNPLGMILMGVTLVAGALMTFNDAMDASAMESNKFGEAAAGVVRNVDTLFRTIDITSSTSKVHGNAIDELVKIYAEYGIKIDEEKDKLAQLNEMREEVIRLIQKEGAERDKANNLAAYDDAAAKETEKMKEQLLKALKSAEWDGSGVIDDWDAKAVQKKADQLSMIIGRLYESEADNLRKLLRDGDMLGYSREMERIINLVKDQYAEITGMSRDLRGPEKGGFSSYFLDVDFQGILTEYITNTQSLLSARDKLSASYEKEAEGQDNVTEKVDLTTLSFEKLFDIANSTNEEVDELSSAEVALKVNKDALDKANESVDVLLNGWALLAGLPVANLGVRIAAKLASQSTPANTGKSDQQEAAELLEQQVTEALKTRKGVADKLKEVSSALETAVDGSVKEKRLLALKKRLTAQQKKFQEAEGKGEKETQAQRLSRIEKANAEINVLLEKNASDRTKLMEDLAFKQEQNSINLEKDMIKRRRRQLILDQDKELSELEREQDAAIKAEVERQRKEFEAVEKAKAEADKRYAQRRFTDGDIDQGKVQAIVDEYAVMFEQLRRLQAKGLDDMLAEELAGMREYLEAYGSLEQNELAIMEKYGKEIRDARGDGARVALLKRQRDEEIAAAEAEEWRDRIDSVALFEQMGLLLSSPLRETVEALRRYVETDAFRGLGFEDQKALLDALAKYEGEVTGMGDLSLGETVEAIVRYNGALREQAIAVEEQKRATEEYRTAEDRLRKARESGDAAATMTAETLLRMAQGRLFAANDNVKGAQTRVTRSSAEATAAMNRFNGSIERFRSIASAVSSGSASGLWNAFGAEFQQQAGLFVSGNRGLLKSIGKLREELPEKGIDVSALEGRLRNKLKKVASSLPDDIDFDVARRALSDGTKEVFADVFGDDNMYGGIADGVGDVVGNKLKANAAAGKALADGIGDEVTGVLDKVEAAGAATGELWSMIIGAVLGLLDEFKDNGIGELAGNLIEDVLGAAGGIIKNAASGRLLTDVAGGLADGFADFWKKASLGGIDLRGWFGIGGNAKEVQATIDRLTERNGRLQTAIEDLTEEMERSRGTKSVAAYRDAYEHQQETNRNYLEIAQAQASYTGSHHSWNHYWKGFTQDEIAKFSKQIGRSWDGDIWSLSPEEMKKLRTNVEMWEKIINTGKGNYGDRLGDKLDDYIDQAGKLEDLTDSLYEGLTKISFDSMWDSFTDKLMDMDAKAEDFADNLSEYFMRAMLSNKVGELYEDQLKEWWNEFGVAMEDNELTEAERHALAEEWMSYVDEALAIRDSLAAATGYDKTASGSSQSGKAGSYAAISQDQGTKLEGLFVSVQGHVANIDRRSENVSAKLSMAESYLAKIAENTGESASKLKEIKELMEKLQRDGIKTR